MRKGFDYYIMKRKSDQPYPLIKVWKKEKDMIHMEISEPVPLHPVMADFLAGPEIIISKRMAQAMQKLQMEGVGFVSAQFTEPDGNINKDYVCALLDKNMYMAMDKKRSSYIYDNNKSYTINRLVLNRSTLKHIPLYKRLAFRLEEAPGYALFHQTVVDTLKAIQPTGVYFEHIERFQL